MDFDKLKSNWQESFKNKGISQEEIRARLSLKGRTDKIISKVIKNYSISLGLLITMYVLIVTGLFVFLKSPVNIVIVILMTLLLFISFSASIRRLKEIRKLSIYDNDVLSALEENIWVMEKSIQFGMGNLYKYIMIPLALIFGIIIGLFIASGDKGFINTVLSLEKSSIIKIVLVIVIGSAITIPFSQIMMQKMFKQHYDELKKCLIELKELISK